MNDIIDITLRTRTLVLMNAGYLDLNSSTNATLYNTTYNALRSSAKDLKIA